MRLSMEDNPCGFVQEILIWKYQLMVDAQTRIPPDLISTNRPGIVIINYPKTTCCIMGFAVPLDHRVEIKENGNRDKYLKLTWEFLKSSGTWE